MQFEYECSLHFRGGIGGGIRAKHLGSRYGRRTASMVSAMAAAAATFAGLSSSEIFAGLESFEGVARRQELRGEVNGAS